jgi:hypothetical protein
MGLGQMGSEQGLEAGCVEAAEIGGVAEHLRVRTARRSVLLASLISITQALRCRSQGR